MLNLWRDLHFAVRLPAKTPTFAAAAVVTLALGIGANTAIFSLADATLVRAVKAVEAERLYAFSWSSAYLDYEEYAKRTDVFAGTLLRVPDFA